MDSIKYIELGANALVKRKFRIILMLKYSVKYIEEIVVGINYYRIIYRFLWKYAEKNSNLRGMKIL